MSPVARNICRPFAAIYGLAVGLRNRAFDAGILQQTASSLPVVSIGNFAAGGSGKSPFTQYLAKELLARNTKPVILSRGYRGKIRGPYRVLPGDDVTMVGDEALMHLAAFSSEVPVVVARKRIQGAQLIEQQRLGDIVLLDDGLQHRYLARDFNCVLIDTSLLNPQDPLQNQLLLPAGSLREQASSALARADVVVVVHRGEFRETASFAIPKSIPRFDFLLEPIAYRDAVSGEVVPAESLRNAPCAVMTAIADSSQFLEMLRKDALELGPILALRDHAEFSSADWSKASDAGTRLVVATAKDAVKLRSLVERPGQLAVLELGGRFRTEADEREFWDLLNSATQTKSIPAKSLRANAS